MSLRPVIDAGPALNFVAAGQERLLFKVLGPLSTPETVEAEVLRKPRQDKRFQRVPLTWSKLTPRWIQVLSDDVTPELDAVCRRVSAMKLADRKADARDLGELMVVAHAVTAAEHRSLAVTVVIDERSGARMATAEAHRLDRLRKQGAPVGSLMLTSTIGILQRAAMDGDIATKADMRTIYKKLYVCDDGLPPIEATPLLSPRLWDS